MCQITLANALPASNRKHKWRRLRSGLYLALNPTNELILYHLTSALLDVLNWLVHLQK